MPCFEKLYEDVCQRNATVDKYGHSEHTLSGHLNDLKIKAENNGKIRPLFSAFDVADITAEYVSQLISSEAANDIRKALEYKVLSTADHHGGLYSAQAFQGDLLFGELLKRMGYDCSYTPIFSFSIVELENSTYARGLCSYRSSKKRELLPIQPKKDLNRMVALTKGFDREMLDRAKILLISEEMGYTPETARSLTKLIDDHYCSADVLSLPRYSDQITRIAERMSRHYFTDDPSRRLVYIEAEEITCKILIKELRDETSLVWHIFYDPAVRRFLNEIKTEEGLSLSSLLLRGADDKGRRIHTQLTEDGKLLGAGMHGSVFEYGTDPDSLIKAIEDRILLPNGFLDAVILCFERGITWLGGYFQAIYLSKWRDLLARVFTQAGLSELSDSFAEMICDGYICGPVYLLSEADHGLCCAGPAELIESPISAELFEKRMDTKLSDAHRMGLFEIYTDLIPGDLKEQGWYETMADHMIERYGEYRI